MKRWIHAATETKNLILAKGFYIVNDLHVDNELRDRLNNSKYSKFVTNLTGWIVFSECEYDPVTNTIYGNLVNHSTLLRSVGIDQPKKYDITNFRVDVSAEDNSTTELTVDAVGGGHKSLVDYLNKMFDVGRRTIGGLTENNEWYDINSPEFKHQFKLASEAAQSYMNKIDDYDYTTNAFGACFAVNDTEIQQGIAVDSYPFIFVTDSYKDYKEAMSRYANELGIPEDNIQFKTVYKKAGYKDYTTEGTPYAKRKMLRQLIKDLKPVAPFKAIYHGPSDQCYLYKSYSRRGVPHDAVRLNLYTDVSVLHPVLEYIDNEIDNKYDIFAKLTLPTSFSYYPGLENELDRIIDEVHDRKLKMKK